MSDFFNDPNANFALDMMMVEELSKDEEEPISEDPQQPMIMTKGAKILLGMIIAADLFVVVGLIVIFA